MARRNVFRRGVQTLRQRWQAQQQQPQQQGQGQPPVQQGGGGGGSGSAFWGKIGEAGADITGRVVRGAIGAKAGAKLGGVVGGPKGAVAGSALLGAGAAVPEAFDSLQKTTTALKDTVDTASTAITTTRDTVKEALKAPVAVYGEGKTALVNVGKGIGHGTAGVAKGVAATTKWTKDQVTTGVKWSRNQVKAGAPVVWKGVKAVSSPRQGLHNMRMASVQRKTEVLNQRTALRTAQNQLRQARTGVQPVEGAEGGQTVSHGSRQFSTPKMAVQFQKLNRGISKSRIATAYHDERSRKWQVREAGLEGRKFDRVVHGVPVLRRVPLIGRPFRGEAGVNVARSRVQGNIRLRKARRAYA